MIKHENIRVKLWVSVYSSAVASSNAFMAQTPENSADRALAKFDERFSQHQPNVSTKAPSYDCRKTGLAPPAPRSRRK